MTALIGLMKVGMVCGTLFLVGLLVLFLLPTSKARSFGIEACKWIGAFLLITLIVSPVDLIPDFFVIVGWLDDLLYLAGGLSLAKSALADRERRQAASNQEPKSVPFTTVETERCSA